MFLIVTCGTAILFLAAHNQAGGFGDDAAHIDADEVSDHNDPGSVVVHHPFGQKRLVYNFTHNIYPIVERRVL